ncbi:amidohydrolase family protein [Antrihabitans cavernicola]|uniref:Amidohydrolase n=1 Tax=Antrihabitans cavernicola TaxID=2495913 RepID=A0A5A7SC53_9NOCA|nr:amidohydrolase family protein [Spelaeibacter cavernicola]KAA0023708.1 amidohydrolase [Spelaeibacter cavernicola]
MDEDAWVTEFWTKLGLPGLIDVHTHFMPDRVMHKVWEYFDSAGPLTGREWPIEYRADEQTRLDTLRGFGVRAFTSLVYPHKADMAAWLNEWTADFAERTPDCLHTGTFFPEPHAASYVEYAIERGTKVFKSHVQVGDYHPNDPLLHPVWKLLEDSAIPTVIHCGSAPAPGAFTGPEAMRDVLERHPRLNLIVAHMGMPDYSSFLDLVEEYPGVHLDTTLAFTDFSEETDPFPVHELPRLQALGDRILWGSDFPNIPFTYAEALAALTRLDLGDDWLRAVVYGNAARMFSIGH